jgi:hypothetical protein
MDSIILMFEKYLSFSLWTGLTKGNVGQISISYQNKLLKITILEKALDHLDSIGFLNIKNISTT